MIPRDEQIRAVLARTLDDLAERYADGDPQAVRRLLTVTADDLVAWIDAHGSAGCIHEAPGALDGVYVVPDGAGFRAYEQERGIPFEARTFGDRAAALAYACERFLLGR